MNDVLDLSQFDGHSDAPWTVVDPEFTRPSRIGVASHGGADVYDAPLTDETRANARLIAAAPQLLEEVRRLRAKVAALESCITGEV